MIELNITIPDWTPSGQRVDAGEYLASVLGAIGFARTAGKPDDWGKFPQEVIKTSTAGSAGTAASSGSATSTAPATETETGPAPQVETTEASIETGVRPIGKSATGKRRTAAEIAEDDETIELAKTASVPQEAIDKAIAAGNSREKIITDLKGVIARKTSATTETAQVSTTPEDRTDPAAAAQDAADEKAETETTKTGGYTRETVRTAMMAYIKAFGQEIASADANPIFASALGDLPEGTTNKDGAVVSKWVLSAIPDDEAAFKAAAEAWEFALEMNPYGREPKTKAA